MGTYVGKRRRQKPLVQLLQHPDLLAASFFLLLVVVAGWPVLAHLDTVIAGDDIDVYINPWADWWTQKALSDPALSLWQTDYLFYPQGADLSYHSYSHLNTALSLLLRPFVGPLPAYNLTVLFNYFLIALAMYHFTRYWTGSAGAGLLAGIVFAFNSHSLYQSCHPVLLSIWTLPWTALFLLKAVERNSLKWAAVAGFFVFLTALVSVLMLILLALWLAALGLFMFATRRWGLSQWRLFALFGLIGAVLSLPVLYPLLREALADGNGSFVVDPYASFVTDLASPVTPHWIHWYIRGIYFGIMPGALLLLAAGRLRQTRFWFALLLVSFLFAAGPRPTLGGEQLDLVLPWSLSLAPLLRNMYRLNIIVSLALAMLVGYGWLVFARHLPRRRAVKGAALLLLALFIFADYLQPTFPHTRLSAPRFYRQVLAHEPEDVAIAIVPSGRQYDKPHLYYQTIHEHKMVNGVVSRAPAVTDDFISSNPLLRAGFMDLPPAPLPDQPQRALEALAAAGVDYLVVEKGWRDLDPEAWRAALPGSPVYEDGQVLVYATHRDAARSERLPLPPAYSGQ